MTNAACSTSSSHHAAEEKHRAEGDAKVIEGQKRALELALHGAPLHEILEVLVRTIESQSSNEVIGSILLLDAGTRRLRHGAGPSLPEEYNAAIDGIEIGPNVGSCGTAAFTGKTVVVSDIQTDPLWSAFKDLAARFDLRACWSKPILSSDGAVLGTFALYHRVPTAPTARDRGLVDLLGHTAALVVERDLHARRRAEAEAELRRSNDVQLRRITTMFENAPAAIAVLRGDEHVFDVANAHYRELIGQRSLVGKPVRQALPEIAGQGLVELLDEVRRTGNPYVGRAQRVMLERGTTGVLEERFFDFVYQPIVDADPGQVATLVVAFEVTAQVKAAHDLARMLAKAEESERQFRDLVENLPELAWTARPDGFIDYYNRRWYEYTGTTFEQMQGWGWKSVHEPTMLDAVVERWRRSIETGEPFEMEFPIRGADGVFRWFLTRVRPLRDVDGKIARWFGSNTNIDERRRNEDFKETFLGILGHDLRNPLNTILTTTRVLCMREDTPVETRKRLERVTSSGARMQRMIEQLLDLTRARLAGGIPVTLSAEEIDVAAVVRKIADEVRAAHPSVAIDVDVQRPTAARLDTDRFEQVVSNLLGNAVTHGDNSRPIRVVVDADDGHAKMTVQNFGRPIDSAFIPKLFNPFVRSEKPQGRSAGLGLGLYISERVIDAHGGRLSASSCEELGTRFEVILPREP